MPAPSVDPAEDSWRSPATFEVRGEVVMTVARRSRSSTRNARSKACRCTRTPKLRPRGPSRAGTGDHGQPQAGLLRLLLSDQRRLRLHDATQASLETLKRLGFRVNPDHRVCDTASTELLEFIREWETKRDTPALRDRRRSGEGGFDRTAAEARMDGQGATVGDRIQVRGAASAKPC